MTTTFKELPIGALFRVSNLNEIIRNRGDRDYFGRPMTIEQYSRYNGDKLRIKKRDEFGGHILKEPQGWNDNFSVYYRIEPDNVVETV